MPFVRSSPTSVVEPLWHLLYRYWFWGWLFHDVNRGDLLRRAAAWRHNVAQRVHLPVYMRRWSACLVATFAIAYPIVGGLASVFGTLAAVVFVQGFLIEGLRFLGDWRNLLFGALIVLAMNVRPRGLLDAQSLARLGRLVGRGR